MHSYWFTDFEYNNSGNVDIVSLRVRDVAANLAPLYYILLCLWDTGDKQYVHSKSYNLLSLVQLFPSHSSSTRFPTYFDGMLQYDAGS